MSLSRGDGPLSRVPEHEPADLPSRPAELCDNVPTPSLCRSLPRPALRRGSAVQTTSKDHVLVFSTLSISVARPRDVPGALLEMGAPYKRETILD